VLGSHGTLVLGTDGGYTYTVTDLTGAAGSHLHDIFSYTVSDGHGGTASAALDITLNRGPVANADVAGVSRGGLVSGNVLANDFDTDGDAIALAALNGGALGQQLHGNYGWLTLYSDGRYSYQSDGNARLPAHGVAQDKFHVCSNRRSRRHLNSEPDSHHLRARPGLFFRDAGPDNLGWQWPSHRRWNSR
jgi:VCBS repeat-containing protein